MKNSTSIFLIIGIVILANLLSNQFFFRWDFTEDKEYTLSKATKDILKNLEEPVMVSAYFSENLPTDIAKSKKDFQEMLIEYSNLSKGMIDYEFINPNENEEKEREAQQNGIRPVMINVREKDQTSQQRAYLGAILKMGDRQEVIPFLQPGGPQEYPLSTSIKKISVVDKPAIGIITGHGEAGLDQLGQVVQSLSVLYNVETLNFNNTESIADRFKAVAMVAPKDSIPANDFNKLDDYLSRGGNILIAANGVNGDLSTSQGTALTTGLETWLKTKGLELENSFIVDTKCGNVSVQQRQGFFNFNTPISFPFLPTISGFTDHPITKGIEEVMMPFASPIRFLGETSATFTPLATTSNKSGIIKPPTSFNVSKKWTARDFPLSNIIVAGVLEGNLAGDAAAKIVLIGDGDFPITNEGGGQTENNISLLSNSIDWLSDDTGLIELRTKGVASRPIDEIEDSEKSMYKWGNFFLPIVLIVFYGFYRMQRKRSIRNKRMQERFA